MRRRFEDDGSPENDSCDFTRDEAGALHTGVLNTTSTRQDSHGASLAFSARCGSVRYDLGATFDRSEVDYAQYEQEAFTTPEREVIGDPEEEPELFSGVNRKLRAYSLYLATGTELGANTRLTAACAVAARVSPTPCSTGTACSPLKASPTRLNPSLGLTYRVAAPAGAVAAARPASCW